VHVDVVATANGAHRQAVSKTVWVIPWALVAIALVVLVGLVHAVSFARRRWRRWRAEQQALREQLAALQADRARAHAGVPAQRDAAATPEPLDDRVALDAEG
jgi:membrane protein YdbS with pleckstrin-like domain